MLFYWFGSYFTFISVVSISKSSPSLKRFNLDDCSDLKDESIAQISKSCSELKFLSLARTRIGDEGVKAIGRNLEELISLNLEVPLSQFLHPLLLILIYFNFRIVIILVDKECVKLQAPRASRP